jgi:hypothetical protein
MIASGLRRIYLRSFLIPSTSASRATTINLALTPID